MKKKPKNKSNNIKYEIDQSGKLEHTNKTTIVALANGKIKTIRIGSTEKQKLLAALKEIEWPKTNYVYRTFAALIFILVKEERIQALEIDKEYIGNEAVIKDTLLYLYTKSQKKIPEIRFVLVGKKSNAHKAALATFQTKIKPTIIVKAEEVMKVLYANKKGRRSRSGRDNP